MLLQSDRGQPLGLPLFADSLRCRRRGCARALTADARGAAGDRRRSRRAPDLRSRASARRRAAPRAWPRWSFGSIPPLAGLVFGDFHENGFAPAAVAWTLYAFDAGLVVVDAGCRRICACYKRRSSALSRDRRRARRVALSRHRREAVLATIVGIAGVVVVVAFFAWIRPHAAAAAALAALAILFVAAGRVRCAVRTRIAARILTAGFVPLLFLPLRSAMMWLAVAPLGEVLLSRMPTTFTLGTHYAGAWLGYVLVAFACAVRDLPAARMRSALGRLRRALRRRARSGRPAASGPQPAPHAGTRRRTRPFLANAAAGCRSRDAGRSLHAPGVARS